MYEHGIIDWFNEMGKTLYRGTEDDKKKFFEESNPKWMKKFEDYVSPKTGFFVTEKMTYVDIMLFVVLDELKMDAGKVKEMGCPKLAHIYDTVRKMENIENYFKSPRFVPQPQK